MQNVRFVVYSSLALIGSTFTLLAMLDFPLPRSAISFLVLPLILAAQSKALDLDWHAPNRTWINDLSQVINGSGTYGFIFNNSVLPPGVKYGTYNWCNMPHVRASEYPRADQEYNLEYVEVIHRHHKRTPYASNTFPKEGYSWDCNDEGLFYYGQPLNPLGNASARSYWAVYTSSTNPFSVTGFNGTCQFPQMTRGGLDDSWQHGRDLYETYHDLLRFLPDDMEDKVLYRVTNNLITSQVASMVINGMYKPSKEVPLMVQPTSIDSLEPAYSCSAASALFASYGVGSSAPNWTTHLTASSRLFQDLDLISGIPSNSEGWHQSFDHYTDSLSSRQCHGKALPCNIADPTNCVTQDQADAVYRLGQYEYSFIYRDSPQSLQASTGSFGIWLAELAQNIRDQISTKSQVIYRHNVAHDGSVSRLLSVLQVDVMVWPGMGAEVVFEVFSKAHSKEKYLRILFNGQILRSSNPSLGMVDMIDLDKFLDYIDGSVGHGDKVISLCQS